MFDPVTPESKLHPASHPDMTIAKENWLESFEPCVEDVEAALKWHEDTYSNHYLNCCIALWSGTSDSKEEVKAKRAKALKNAVDEIVQSYAEEVLWPEAKKGIR